jgi:hypothetical protein
MCVFQRIFAALAGKAGIPEQCIRLAYRAHSVPMHCMKCRGYSCSIGAAGSQWARP